MAAVVRGSAWAMARAQFGRGCPPPASAAGNRLQASSLLSIATAQFEMGDSAASRRTLEDVIKKYPQSEAAAKARQRLAIR